MERGIGTSRGIGIGHVLIVYNVTQGMIKPMQFVESISLSSQIILSFTPLKVNFNSR